jgi:dTDP-4-amino-4,6-dideoxygalactose transaminase
MTLELDDVRLAQTLLKDCQAWYGEAVVNQFETEFAHWNGSDHAFAFMGGRVALSACIYALGLQPGDEVILPGYTCIVVPNAFHFAGVKTVYSDIELDTYGLDAGAMEEKITPKTRVILLHHLYGLVCRDYERILELARKYNLRVIEDCAHATGAEYRGVKVGNRGDLAFYSTEQSKVLTTVQGGIAITNDVQLAAKIREFQADAQYPDPDWIERQLHNVLLNYYQAKHPQRWWLSDVAELRYGRKRLISTNQEEMEGRMPAHYGQKMPAAIAALGLNQLRKIDKFNALRVENAKKWASWCDECCYPKPLEIEGSKAVYLRYPVLFEREKKRKTSWALNSLGVVPGVWFVSHVHPVAQRIEGCPNADKAVNQCINLPTIFT